jgi:hypothetical protein
MDVPEVLISEDCDALGQVVQLVETVTKFAAQRDDGEGIPPAIEELHVVVACEKDFLIKVDASRLLERSHEHLSGRWDVGLRKRVERSICGNCEKARH